MTNGDKPRQKPDFKLEKMDDDLLLYHPDENKIFYCNETAALIWQLCNGERTPEEISALISAAYPEAADAIVAQVESTLRQFHEQGAIDYI
jgi:hypothetical protein